jgi:putative ABC transport system permease protein
METLLHDVKYGLRTLGKNPGFTAIAVLTLALGIGANSAIFSVVDTLLLNSLPFEESDRLMHITERGGSFPEMSVAYLNFTDWRERSDAFSHIAAVREEQYNVTGLERPVQVEAVQTSAALFPMLGVPPLQGRVYGEAEDQVGATKVAVLSYPFWSTHLGADPAVIGTTIALDDEPYEILGVMPRGFTYPLNSDNVGLWIPIGQFAERWQNRGNHPGIRVTARLADGVTPARAREELETIAAALAEEYPDSNTGNSVNVIPLQERLTRNLKDSLWVLFGAVLLVLMIACVNVANLLLVRAAGRGQEMAVRGALGAGRGRLTRQLLTESVLLALAGGALGLLVAHGALRLMRASLDPRVLPGYVDLSLDGRVLLFTLLVAVATGVLFGLAPAWQTARGALAQLRDGGRTSVSTGGRRLRSALVIAEVALALLPLFGAMIFLESLGQLTGTDPGVKREGVLTFFVSLPESRYSEAVQVSDGLDRIVEAVAALPGVSSAAHTLPLMGGWQSSIGIEGRPPAKPGESISTEVLRVSPDYFKTLGMRLLDGRFLEARDREDAPRVAVIDEVFAEQIWPGENPLGKRFRFGGGPPEEGEEIDWITVVGMTNHIKSYGVHQPSRMQTYLPARQSPLNFARIVVKTDGDPYGLARSAESAVLTVDPSLPAAEFISLEDWDGRNIWVQRFAAGLLGAFAGLAMLLAAVGIYSVMAYSVAQRRREIGVRMALGAGTSRVLRMVVSQTLRLALVGIAIGLVVVVVAAPSMSDLLFQVDPRNLPTLLALPALLSLIALAAAFFPARRAAGVEPMAALRQD